MSFTVNQLALELIRAHGENSSDPNYVLTVEQWIRDAFDELALETNWRALQIVTTLATLAPPGANVYKLPFNARDIKYIRDPATETNLVYLTRERMAGLNFDIENISTPQFWGYYDLAVDTVPNPDEYVYEIFFHPVPDRIITYDIGYVINPSGLLTSSIIPLLSDTLAALRPQVRAYMCMDDGDTNGASWWRGVFLQQVQKLRFREHTKHSDVPTMQIRDISNRTDRRLARLDPNHFG